MSHLSRSPHYRASQIRRVSDWNSHSHGLGLDVIDHDHNLIFIALGTLENELGFLRRGLTLAKTVRFLSHLTDSHFVREERLMERLDYPHTREHREQHGLLKAWMDAVLPSLGEIRRPAYDDAVVAYLADWWSLHTERHDRRYGIFAAERRPETLAILKELSQPHVAIGELN